MKNQRYLVFCRAAAVFFLLALQCSSVKASEELIDATPYRSLKTLQQRMNDVQKIIIIPIAIPITLPDYRKPDNKNNEYITFIKYNRNSYRFGIDYQQDCDYEKCSELAFFGDVKFWYEKPERNFLSLTLKNGDKAFYYESVCSLSCSQAKFAWKHNQFYYMIEGVINAEEGIAIADSMIYGNPKIQSQP
jgi:hypothetical protein